MDGSVVMTSSLVCLLGERENTELLSLFFVEVASWLKLLIVSKSFLVEFRNLFCKI